MTSTTVISPEIHPHHTEVVNSNIVVSSSSSVSTMQVSEVKTTSSKLAILQESTANVDGNAKDTPLHHPLPQQPHNNIVITEESMQPYEEKLVQQQQQQQQQTTSPKPAIGDSEVSDTLDNALAKNSSESQERDNPAWMSKDSINSNHAPLDLTQHNQNTNNSLHITTTTTTTTTAMPEAVHHNNHNDENSPQQISSTNDIQPTVSTTVTTVQQETDEPSTPEVQEEEHISVTYEFYMNDGSTPSNNTRTRPLNSELAGDSDDDEDEHINKSKTSHTALHVNVNSAAASTAGSLATVTSDSTSPSITPSQRPSTSSSSPDGSKTNDIDTSRDMLTRGQAFAYVGLVLVTANTFFQALDSVPDSPESARAKESLESFISKLIYSLSKHMDIDADTQRTIAQLPQMMIQPEDLLESFEADGTSRVVSTSQVDQTSLTRPASPAMSTSTNASSASASPSTSTFPSSLSSYKNSQLPSTLSSETLVNAASTTAAPLPQASSSQQPQQPETPRRSISSNTSTESTPSEAAQRVGSNSPPTMARHSFASIRSASSLTLGSSSGGRSARSITVDLKWTLIADLFLIAIGDSVYDSRARVLLKMVGKHLGLEWTEIVQMEQAIMKQLQQSSTYAGTGSNSDLLKVDTKSRNAETRKRRMIMMGLATVGGGLVLGLSAGLFAPVIGAGIGAALAGAHITGATATAASAFLAGSGGVAVITSGAAVTGSGLAMKKMARRTAGIDTFEFIAVHDNNRANLILTISGWLDIGEEDATLPFSTLEASNGDHTALLWEPDMLMNLGSALGLLASEILTLTAQEILKHTLLGGLLSALAWPMALTRLGYLIDNPWSTALDRAKLAGLVLADCLVMRSYLGFRPVTLVGYSLGARVIFYCLVELARLDAFGIVEDVFLFGAPVTASSSQWRQAQSVVAGDFVNGYLKSDWVLGFLFRATTGGLGTVAGLRPLQNVGDRIRNVDLTGDVDGHMDYRLKIPMLMRKVANLSISSESFLDKEEEVLFQRQQKRKNPNEPLRAPKPKMPSKAELENSQTLTDEEKKQLEAAFRRPAPKAKVPDVDSIKGLTDEERKKLKEALGIAN
ncbi:hypothetical protein BGW41_003375 [Actinomortierella wolfii]|nr:hypothetical protein BGW41_003375 [Actinomortierella wolfii]